MGTYDGAEATDIDGLFILNKMKKFNLNIGLYRDDGLGVSNLTNRRINKVSSSIVMAWNHTWSQTIH